MQPLATMPASYNDTRLALAALLQQAAAGVHEDVRVDSDVAAVIVRLRYLDDVSSTPATDAAWALWREIETDAHRHTLTPARFWYEYAATVHDVVWDALGGGMGASTLAGRVMSLCAGEVL